MTDAPALRDPAAVTAVLYLAPMAEIDEAARLTDDVTQVFVYGTLKPRELRWPSLAPFLDGEPVAATVDGQLWDTGYGWPAMTDGAAVVEGVVVTLRAASVAEALAVLDAIEGVDGGLFERRVVTTHQGLRCWAYVWPGPPDGFGEVVRSWNSPIP